MHFGKDLQKLLGHRIIGQVLQDPPEIVKGSMCMFKECNLCRGLTLTPNPPTHSLPPSLTHSLIIQLDTGHQSAQPLAATIAGLQAPLLTLQALKRSFLPILAVNLR